MLSSKHAHKFSNICKENKKIKVQISLTVHWIEKRGSMFYKALGISAQKYFSTLVLLVQWLIPSVEKG